MILVGNVFIERKIIVDMFCSTYLLNALQEAMFGSSTLAAQVSWRLWWLYVRVKETVSMNSGFFAHFVTTKVASTTTKTW